MRYTQGKYFAKSLKTGVQNAIRVEAHEDALKCVRHIVVAFEDRHCIRPIP